jgi:hypothetical protein
MDQEHSFEFSGPFKLSGKVPLRSRRTESSIKVPIEKEAGTIFQPMDWSHLFPLPTKPIFEDFHHADILEDRFISVNIATFQAHNMRSHGTAGTLHSPFDELGATAC